MRRTLRHLILWLCMAALPLQGLAAAAMLHCQHEHAPAQSLVAEQAVAHDDCHGHDAQAATGDTGAGACSACAACCAGWAVWPVPHALPAAPDGLAPVVLLSAAAAPFVTDGPERPPRSLA